jgi:hypothetical protein
MSNAAIFDRMREACDMWDSGGMDCLALGTQLVGLAEALEGVPRRVVEDAREWRLALEVASDPASFGDHELAIAQLIEVVARIRPWIEAVSAGRSGMVPHHGFL